MTRWGVLPSPATGTGPAPPAACSVSSCPIPDERRGGPGVGERRRGGGVVARWASAHLYAQVRRCRLFGERIVRRGEAVPARAVVRGQGSRRALAGAEVDGSECRARGARAADLPLPGGAMAGMSRPMPGNHARTERRPTAGFRLRFGYFAYAWAVPSRGGGLRCLTKGERHPKDLCGVPVRSRRGSGKTAVRAGSRGTRKPVRFCGGIGYPRNGE